LQWLTFICCISICLTGCLTGRGLPRGLARPLESREQNVQTLTHPCHEVSVALIWKCLWFQLQFQSLLHPSGSNYWWLFHWRNVEICSNTTFLQFQGVPSCTSCTVRVIYFKKKSQCPQQTSHEPFLRATAYMLSAHMLSQFRLSVCLSVCPSVTWVDQSKTVEVRIMQFSPYSSPIPLVFAH